MLNESFLGPNAGFAVKPGSEAAPGASLAADADAACRALVEGVQQGLAMLSAEGRVLYANRFIEALLGTGPLAGGFLRDALPGFPEPLLGEAAHGPVETVFRLDRRDGAGLSLHCALGPLPPGSGAAISLAVADIGPALERETRLRMQAEMNAANGTLDLARRTALKLMKEAIEVRAKTEAEAALRESERRFRDLFERMPDPAWIVIDHRFVDANPAALAAIGYDQKPEFLSLHPSELSPERQPDGELSYVKAERHIQTVAALGVHRFDWMHVRADGTPLPVEVTLTTIEFQGKKAIYAIWRDISQRLAMLRALQASEELFRSIFEGTTDAIMLLTEQGFFDCNQHTLDLFGYPDKSFLIASHPADLSPPTQPDGRDSRFVADEYIRKAFEQGCQRFEWTHRTPDGIDFPVDILLSAFECRGERVLQAAVRDITERKRAEEKLHQAASVFNETSQAILITGPEAKIVEVNHAFVELTGYAKEEVIGKSPKLLNSGHHGPDFFKAMLRSLAEHGRWHGDIWNRRKDGSLFASRLTITAIKDNAGHVHRYIAFYAEATQTVLQQQRLEHQAHYDILTGLPNRSLLEDRVLQALAHAKRWGTSVAICFLDLDGFKPVNDQYGHKAGDLLLIEIARRLQGSVREHDTVARMGGDEFILLLTGITAAAETPCILDRVVENIAKPCDLSEGMSVRVSASIGFALYPEDGQNQEELMRYADQAMYRAKQAGRNRIEKFGLHPK